MRQGRSRGGARRRAFVCALGAFIFVATAAGPASAAVPDTPPQPGVAGANTRITVSFLPPAANGSPITAYHATCTDGVTPVTVAGGASPIIVSPLTNGNSYTCTVDATNADGTSGESIASAPVVPAATAPDPPAQPTLALGNSQLVVSFSTPADNGSAITGYFASCSSTDGGVPGTAPLSGATASPITVVGLSNGHTYTCNVTATNGIGTSAPSPNSAPAIVAGVPDQPAQPNAAVGNAQLAVTFGVPANNGSVITGYHATCSDGVTPVTAAGAASPIIVSPLTNGTSYTCTVTATNGAGTSPASPASAAAVPATVPTAPAQPTIVTGNTQLAVTFAAPAGNGSAITGYFASCSSTDGGAPGTAPLAGATASPITVTGLTNGHTYTCNVTATNGIGTSAPSPNSAAALVAGVPDQPAQPTVAAGNAQIAVTFGTPANNGSAITGYNATCTDGVTPASIAGTTSPITVTGLTNGNSYTCTVTASNSAGAGPASPASATAIPATVPAGPAQPTIAAGNNEVVVTFVAPANNGSAITGYNATCTDGVTPVSIAGATSPIAVTGLTNGHSYTCTVTATNGAGTGPASPASAAATPANVPAAPAQPSVAAGDAQIVVAFNAPAANGSPITGYSATCTDGGAPVTIAGTASPIAVTGLTNGHSYTCTVTAANSAGASPASPASLPVVVGLPSAPPAPGVAPGDAQITLTFVAPVANGSAITNFTATCSSSNGGVTGSSSGPGSPLTVPGLTNGKTYTCALTATNAAGTGPSSPASVGAVPAGVPGAPTSPTATGGNERITVAFGPPADNGGSSIAGYTATCTSTSTGLTGSISGPGSPLTVANLFNGENYICVVTATNAIGTSPPSATTAAVVAATVPAAPTIIGATGGSGTMTVSFAAVSDNGSPITSYTATCASANGGITRSMSGAGSPLTVPGLTNGNSYSCKVSATNAVGPSVASAASNTLVVGSPGPPTIASIVSGPAPKSKGSLKVSVRAGPSNADPMMAYRVTCTPTSGGATRVKTGVVSPISVTGLLAGHEYSCTAVATNLYGVSATSNPMTLKVGTPAPPKVVKVLKVAHGFAVLVSPSADNGHPITNYRAQCTSTNGGASSSPTQAASPIVVNKLTDGRTYRCLVTAINSRGASPPTVVGPVVVSAVKPQTATTCSGRRGNVRDAPGLLLALPRRIASCSGRRSARVPGRT